MKDLPAPKSINLVCGGPPCQVNISISPANFVRDFLNVTTNEETKGANEITLSYPSFVKLSGFSTRNTYSWRTWAEWLNTTTVSPILQ